MIKEYKQILGINDCSLDYENMDSSTLNILLAAMLCAFYNEHTPTDLLLNVEIIRAKEIIKNLQKEFNKRTYFA